MPILPVYYEDLINHFHVLSRSRSYGFEVYTNKKGGISTRRHPNPIDISSILDYNRAIYKALPAIDFLEIMQLLDAMHIQHENKRGH